MTVTKSRGIKAEQIEETFVPEEVEAVVDTVVEAPIEEVVVEAEAPKKLVGKIHVLAAEQALGGTKATATLRTVLKATSAVRINEMGRAIFELYPEMSIEEAAEMIVQQIYANVQELAAEVAAARKAKADAAKEALESSAA